MQTFFYPPNNEKQYSDDNIIDVISSYISQINGVPQVCLKYSIHNDKIAPWICVSGNNSINDYYIILLPDFSPMEEKSAKKEMLRLKRVLKKRLPNIKITSNLRLNPKELIDGRENRGQL